MLSMRLLSYYLINLHSTPRTGYFCVYNKIKQIKQKVQCEGLFRTSTEVRLKTRVLQLKEHKYSENAIRSREK